MAAAESILFQINSTNYSAGPFTIYKPQLGNSGFITTLRLTVNLKSISQTDFPYIPDDTPANVLQEILDKVALETEFKEIVLFFRKGAGQWIERAPVRIFNKDPYYDVNLIRLFSDANTIDVSEDLSLGIQVKLGNTLASSDNILVWGTVVEEKKNNGNEELAARIEALELALAGRLTEVPANILLGRNTGTGIIQQIPMAQFATPAQITAAINTLIGNAGPALDTIAELGAALANDASFAATIANQLALKAPISNPVFTGFTTLGENIAIKQKLITGTVGSQMGGYTVVNHGITGVIVGVQSTVQNGGIGVGAMTPGFTVPSSGLEYYAYTTSTQFIIYTHTTNSGSIINKRFEGLITYRAS